jgi:hypothetical protein
LKANNFSPFNIHFKEINKHYAESGRNQYFWQIIKKEQTNMDKLLAYIQKNVEILVGIFKGKGGMEDPGINGKSILKQENRRSWLDTICLGI